MQRPPAYSAVKVGGERLYRKARRGEPVEGAARPVTVYRHELLWRDAERAGIEIECSAGTYVRQLIAGLGDAYCEQLERTAIGPFRLEDADAERLVPLAQALSFMPAHELEQGEAERVAHGLPVAGEAAGEAVRLVCGSRLVAIARPDGDALKPFVVLPP
jgi:tRNA pseudouridine55 synthase